MTRMRLLLSSETYMSPFEATTSPPAPLLLKQLKLCFHTPLGKAARISTESLGPPVKSFKP